MPLGASDRLPTLLGTSQHFSPLVLMPLPRTMIILRQGGKGPHGSRWAASLWSWLSWVLESQCSRGKAWVCFEDKLQRICVPWWKSKPSLATSPPGEGWPLRFGSETGHWYSYYSPWVSSPSPPFCPPHQPHSLGHFLLFFLQSYILFLAPSQPGQCSLTQHFSWDPLWLHGGKGWAHSWL